MAYDEHTRRWTVAPGEHKTIDIDDVTALRIALASGRVDVIGQDDPVCRLEIGNVVGRNLTVEVCRGVLRIEQPEERRPFRLFDVFIGRRGVVSGTSADVSLLVPRSVAAHISCVNGDTLVGGLTADTHLETVNGAVLADGLSGALKLNNVGGRVEARNHHGEVKADTVNGDVTVSGDCRAVEVHSVNGALYLDAFGSPDRVTFNAVSGDATIRLDPEVHARYSVETMGGHADIDGRTFRSALRNFAYEDGPDDGPESKVRFQAVGGSLRILRRAVEPFDPDPEKTRASDEPAAFGGGGAR